MKKFSNEWKKSTQPRKQRKYIYNIPMHLKGKLLTAPLSEELRKKHGIRSLRVCVGDKVKIMRGQYQKKSGKVEKVDTKNSRVYVTGVEFTKKDGSRTLYPIHASKVMIEECKTDKKRFQQKKE